MKTRKILWFTIPEMIIVMTLLAILWTISFFAFTWYSTDARDSVRVTDLKHIETWLETYYSDVWTYPKPNDAVSITYKWAMIWEQWSFWDNAFLKIRVLNSLPVDPSFDNEYSYSVLNDSSQFELIWVLEWEVVAFNSMQANAKVKQVAYAYTSWNYNWLLAKVYTWWIDYVLAIPSITSNDSDSTDIIDIINNKSLVYNGYTNIPLVYKSSDFKVEWDFNYNTSKLVIFSWSLLDLSEWFNQVAFLKNFQDSYSWSIISSNDFLLNNIWKLSVNTLLPSSKAKLIACDIINFKLNYDITCDWLDYIASVLEELIDDNLNWESNTFSNILFNLPWDNITAVFRDSSWWYWFWTDDWLAYFDWSDWTTFQVDNSWIISNDITSVTEAIDWSYWIWTTNWISQLLADLITWNTYTADDIGLKKDDIYYIFTSDNWAVWVWTTKWVATLSDWVWEQYTKKSDNLATDRVKVIYEDTAFNVWFWSFEKGVDKMVYISPWLYEDDLVNYKPSNTPGMPSNKATYIVEDDSNNMWFWTEAWIWLLDSDWVTWSTPYTSANSPAWLYSDFITYIFEDTGNNFWFGTNIWLARLDNDLTTWTHYGKADTWTNKLKSDNIISIYENWDGNILVLWDEWMDTIDNSLEVNPVNP